MGNGRLEASGRRFAGFFRYRLTTSHTPPSGMSEELAAQNQGDKIRWSLFPSLNLPSGHFILTLLISKTNISVTHLPATTPPSSTAL